MANTSKLKVSLSCGSGGTFSVGSARNPADHARLDDVHGEARILTTHARWCQLSAADDVHVVGHFTGRPRGVRPRCGCYPVRQFGGVIVLFSPAAT